MRSNSKFTNACVCSGCGSGLCNQSTELTENYQFLCFQAQPSFTKRYCLFPVTLSCVLETDVEVLVVCSSWPLQAPFSFKDTCLLKAMEAGIWVWTPQGGVTGLRESMAHGRGTVNVRSKNRVRLCLSCDKMLSFTYIIHFQLRFQSSYWQRLRPRGMENGVVIPATGPGTLLKSL